MFKSELIVREMPHSHREWMLAGDLEYQGNEDMFKVPWGFVTNFASVPRMFWSIVSPWDKHMKAAVVHDYCYKTGCVSRLDADGIFRRMMKELGVSWWRRQAMYRAVRLFGGSHYKK